MMQARELKQYRKYLEQACAHKDFMMVCKLVNDARRANLPHQEWTTRSFQLFVMLTDPAIYQPTFIRRGAIFSTFSTIIRYRIAQANLKNVPDVRKKVEFLIKIVEGMFRTLALHKPVDNQMHTSFHKFTCKLLQFCAGFVKDDKNNGDSQRFDPRFAVLQAAYQAPQKRAGKREYVDDFKSTDLILWYELLLVLRNTIQIHSADQKIGDSLTKIWSCTLQVEDPILKWVGMHRTIQQLLKSLRDYEFSQIQSSTLKTTTHITNECKRLINTHFNANSLQNHLINTPNQDLNDNLLKIAIRFNIFQSIFIYLQQMTDCVKDKEVVKILRRELISMIEVLTGKVKKLFQIEEYKPIYERLYKLIGEYLYFHKALNRLSSSKLLTNTKTQFIKKEQINNQLIDLELICKIFDQQQKQQLQIDNFIGIQQLLIVQQEVIKSENNTKWGKLSELIPMSKLVHFSMVLQYNNFQRFHDIITKNCSTRTCLRIYISLITEYFINSLQILNHCLQTGLLALHSYIICPQLINREDFQALKQIMLVGSLANTDINHKFCNFCGQFELESICSKCDQFCFDYIYSNVIKLNYSTIYHNYIAICEYFVKCQLTRIDPELRTEIKHIMTIK